MLRPLVKIPKRCPPSISKHENFQLWLFVLLLFVLWLSVLHSSEAVVVTRLVIGTSRTVGSAKKFVRITSGFGGGEFTKTLRKVCTCQKLKFSFLLLEYCKSENTMLWRMLSRLETCIVYYCIWSVTLAKSIVPRKTWRKLWHSYISNLFLTKMQVKFSIFFHHRSLNVIGDKFRFVRSKLKSRYIYKLSIFSFSCLRRSVLIEHIANAWGDLLVLVRHM